MRRKLAAGNWKMNGTSADLDELRALIAAHPTAGCDILICPPATLLARMSDLTRASAIATGGQDCHPAESGAHTGEISAAMLADAGAEYVILGHSERRADHGESSDIVAQKARAALNAGLVAIICVGETLAEREAGETLAVIREQLAGSVPKDAPAGRLVVAYEPVWAIGTGLTPTRDQIGEVHDFMRAQLAGILADADAIRLLYGGSVKPDNAGAIFGIDNVDGALVGGASLKAADFSRIIAALAAN